MVLFIRDLTLDADVVAVFNSSGIIQNFLKSNPVSHLIDSKFDICKTFSNILMKQHFLCLMCYYQLACSLLFLSYIQRYYLWLSFSYFSYKYQQYYFQCASIHSVSVIILQTVQYHRIIFLLLQIKRWYSNIKIFCIVYQCVIVSWYA